MLPTLAAAYEASGDRTRAERTVQEAIRRARASDCLVALASALVVRGRLNAGRGCWTAAEQNLEEAVCLARDMPYPHREARGLLDWGVMCRRTGDSERARERLEKALAVFQMLGCRPFMDRTAHALEASRNS